MYADAKAEILGPTGELNNHVVLGAALGPKVRESVSELVERAREGLSGFFLQEPPDREDGDPDTSEGLFVFDGTTPLAVPEWTPSVSTSTRSWPVRLPRSEVVHHSCS